MKNWFNQQGTITGWQAIGRNAVALLIYLAGVGAISAEFGPVGFLIFIPAMVFYVWLGVATLLKRMQAFGFVGEWYNLFFPCLTDATYPKRKK